MPVLIYFFQNYDNYLLILPAAPIMLLSLFNFRFAAIVFIGSMFVNILILNATPSEIFSFFLVLAFLITYRFQFIEFRNRILYFFILFAVLTIPSFFGFNQILNLVMVLRLAAFLMVFSVISVAFRDTSKIKLILNVFLLFSGANAFHLFYQAATTGRRVFGFAGIMYVDYVGISIVISLLYLLYSHRHKWIYLSGLGIFLVSLILTQTRNAWLTSGILILLILSHFVFFNKKIELDKVNKYLIISLIAFLSVFIFLQARTLNPATFSRVENLVPEGGGQITNLEQINTFLTRIFIWDTAWNAFKENPVTGVGLYNFHFVSEKYYTVHPVLYKEFVKGLSPHQAFLEILSETGILGFTGFIIFLSVLLYYAYRNIRLSRTTEQRFTAYLLFWVNSYILASMLMTDAWLWGHGFMLWAVIIGLTIALRKVIYNSE